MDYLKKAVNRLNADLSNNDKPSFLFSLQDIAIKETFLSLSEKTGLSREGLYKILNSRSGNPRLTVLMEILDAMGLQLKVALKESKKEIKNGVRENSIAHCYPLLKGMFIPEKNKGMTLNDVRATSRLNLVWNCLTNPVHEWQESPLAMIRKIKENFINRQNFNFHSLNESLKGVCPICKLSWRD